MSAQEPEQRFGRDGISGLVSMGRAVRARDVSRPDPEQLARAAQLAAKIVRRRIGRVTQA
ncbi:MAG: hypothetical protein HY829_01555 [Actinobacteria bacterium]|nr:hypothetical protein [Actinomycetota bacterium]